MRRARPRKRRLQIMPLSRLFPNMVTIAGLCCGLSSVHLALEGKFEVAVILIVAAAIIDGMDGRIARFLNSTSTFGAQLDSLSDFVCFGVAPALVLYLWQLQELKPGGWALVLFFAVCCALRLARFNTNLVEDSEAPWQMKFFTGVPSPAGGMLALMPLVASFTDVFDFLDNAKFSGIWLAFVAVLMASRLPTFAVKRIHIHHESVLPVMLGCCFAIVMVVVAPWTMFLVCGALYCCSIPASFLRYRKLAAIYKTSAPKDDGFLPPE